MQTSQGQVSAIATALAVRCLANPGKSTDQPRAKHTFLSTLFFSIVSASICLRMAILFLEIGYFSAIGLALGIACKALLPSLEKLLGPAVILTGYYAFTATQFSNRLFSSKPFQDNANLLFGVRVSCGLCA